MLLNGSAFWIPEAEDLTAIAETGSLPTVIAVLGLVPVDCDVNSSAVCLAFAIAETGSLPTVIAVLGPVPVDCDVNSSAVCLVFKEIVPAFKLANCWTEF